MMPAEAPAMAPTDADLFPGSRGGMAVVFEL